VDDRLVPNSEGSERGASSVPMAVFRDSTAARRWVVAPKVTFADTGPWPVARWIDGTRRGIGVMARRLRSRLAITFSVPGVHEADDAQ